MNITSAKFIKSASKLEECPPADFPEFAIVGRSNVGKSSLINMMTSRKQLAKSSITPGKTQLLNYFLINDARYLVDLPGYGYAKYSKDRRIQWMDSMQEYLTKRESLQLVFVLIDGSIPTQKIDIEFMQILEEDKIPFDIIVTKTDKSNQSDLHKNIKSLNTNLSENLKNNHLIFQTSSVKGRGKDLILDTIGQMI